MKASRHSSIHEQSLQQEPSTIKKDKKCIDSEQRSKGFYEEYSFNQRQSELVSQE
jgi:hypothetical protein